MDNQDYSDSISDDHAEAPAALYEIADQQDERVQRCPLCGGIVTPYAGCTSCPGE